MRVYSHEQIYVHDISVYTSLLILSFLFLFGGYTGLRGYFDAGPSSDKNLPLLSLIALSTFSYVTGAGGSAGLIASINSTARSFPERLVSSIQIHYLICDRSECFSVQQP